MVSSQQQTGRHLHARNFLLQHSYHVNLHYCTELLYYITVPKTINGQTIAVFHCGATQGYGLKIFVVVVLVLGT